MTKTRFGLEPVKGSSTLSTFKLTKTQQVQIKVTTPFSTQW